MTYVKGFFVRLKTAQCDCSNYWKFIVFFVNCVFLLPQIFKIFLFFLKYTKVLNLVYERILKQVWEWGLETKHNSFIKENINYKKSYLKHNYRQNRQQRPKRTTRQSTVCDDNNCLWRRLLPLLEQFRLGVVFAILLWTYPRVITPTAMPLDIASPLTTDFLWFPSPHRRHHKSRTKIQPQKDGRAIKGQISHWGEPECVSTQWCLHV